jgi:hypothetical protein
MSIKTDARPKRRKISALFLSSNHANRYFLNHSGQLLTIFEYSTIGWDIIKLCPFIGKSFEI